MAFGRDLAKRVAFGVAVLATAWGALGSPASADGPLSLWYQRGGTPEQQRVLQSDLGEPFNAAHPGDTLTLDVRPANSADKQIRCGKCTSG